MLIFLFLAIGLGIGSKKFDSLKKKGFFLEKCHCYPQNGFFHKIHMGGLKLSNRDDFFYFKEEVVPFSKMLSF